MTYAGKVAVGFVIVVLTISAIVFSVVKIGEREFPNGTKTGDTPIVLSGDLVRFQLISKSIVQQDLMRHSFMVMRDQVTDQEVICSWGSNSCWLTGRLINKYGYPRE